MDKNKLNNLIKYRDKIKSELESPIPDKHKDHPNQYKAYLTNELRLVNTKLEKAKDL